MSTTALSPAERSNLAALQSIGDLLEATQQRLATGVRAATAAENPDRFFTAQTLGARASHLNSLLDRIVQAQQTARAAHKGLDATMSLVQSAIATAQQATRAPSTAQGYDYLASVIGGTNVTPSSTPVLIAGVVLGQTSFGGTVIRVGGVTYTVSSMGTAGPQQIVDDINNTPGLGPGGAATASVDASGRLVLASNGTGAISVDPLSGGALAAGLVNPNLTQAVPGLSGTTLTVQANDWPPRTITFGAGAGEVTSYGDLKQALDGSNVDASIYPFGGPPRLKLFAINDNMSTAFEPSLTIDGSALPLLGMMAGRTYGSLYGPPERTRAMLAQQYNTILEQIDRLAADSGYVGINLLKGANVEVAFNETGTSRTTIIGRTDDAAGLGLTPVSDDGLQNDTDVAARLAALTSALTKLRTHDTELGSSLAVLRIREQFTRELAATLMIGADYLALADTDNEGATLLALQTRQQLAVSALSLSVRSRQAVLKLFV